MSARRDAINDVIKVMNAGLETYKPDGLLLWLTHPNKMLDGKSALGCIADDETDRVLAALDALASGAFV